MAKGRKPRDRATGWLGSALLRCWGAGLGLAGIGHGGAQLPGGRACCSPPDLDTRFSNATRRWGPLRLLWWPYARGSRPPLLVFPQSAAGHGWDAWPTWGVGCALGAWQRCCLFRGAAAPGACWAGRAPVARAAPAAC